MVLPIRAYGDPVLKRVAADIEKGHPGLDQLIKDMFETMYAANGVGLAAPQIGQGIRLFVVDTHAGSDEEGGEKAPDSVDAEPRLKKVFINAYIVDEEGEEWGFEEGCLSIPGMYGEVERFTSVTVQGLDRQGAPITVQGYGLLTRALQHEIDHLEGVLFIERAQSVFRERKE